MGSILAQPSTTLQVLMLDVTFYGVRGSTPCSGPGVHGHGGNTSCVLVRAPGEDPIICDMGTGLRQLGLDLLDELAQTGATFSGTALLSHLHWDHVQGVPFFPPALTKGANLAVYGPKQEERSLVEVVDTFIAPPLFPVKLSEVPGEFSFHELNSDSVEVGSAKVKAFDVRHVGPTNGYRIDHGSGSVAYIPDCQQPLDGTLSVSDSVIAACEGVDVLIHDAQYSPEEFVEKATWGHCTPDYALEVAKTVGARRLVLFHHDPTHDDAWIVAMAERLRSVAGDEIEVLAAYEGLTLRSGVE